MVCPFCLHKKTNVYNSRPTKRLNAMWRRRRCSNCTREFTTRELIAADSIIRVQAGKKIGPFLKSKLILSVLKACDHLPQDDAAYWLCDTIEQRLLKQGATSDGVVTTNDIAEVTLAVLKAFNMPAFVKYLSYHAPALDSRTLKRELKKR